MILGIIEHDRGQLNNQSLEMLMLARQVAAAEGVGVTAVLIDKFTGYYHYLFTTPVLVWLKLFVIRPVNQRGVLRLEFMQR